MKTTRHRCIRLSAMLAAYGIFAATLAADEKRPALKVAPAAENESVASNPTTNEAERDQLWQQAKSYATEKDWQQAADTAEKALRVHRAHFADQPMLTLQILEASCYWQTRQKDFTSALAIADELLQQRTQFLGPNHWQTIDARLNKSLIEKLAELDDVEWQQFLQTDEVHAQAAAHQRDGDHAAALAILEHALPTYTRLLGRDTAPTLTCLANTLICHLELGQLFKAHPLVIELIDKQPRLQGPLHPETVRSLTLLARFNETVGDLANSEAAYRRIVEIQTVMRGPAHPETIRARADVGKIWAEQGRLDDAVPLLSEILRQQQNIIGEQHPATAQTMKVLGAAYRKQQNYADAALTLEKAVLTIRRQLGEDHVATAGALNERGRFYAETKQFGRAAADLQRSVEICNDSLGREHPTTGKVLANLADLHERQLDTGQARQYRQQCLTIAEQSFGETNVLTADALENLARTYVVMNDFSLAEPYLLRARETRRQLLGEEHPQTGRVIGQLAYVYLGVGDPDRAKPLFQKAVAIAEGNSDDFAAGKIRQRLALLYQSEGEFSQAEKEYRLALAALHSSNRKLSPLSATAKVGLAQSLLSLSKTEEAQRQIEEVLEFYAQIYSDTDPNWIDALGVAGTIYLAVGKTELAELALSRGLRIARLRMEAAGAYESQRQRIGQLAIMRNMFDLYLSLPSRAEDTTDIYSHVLAWKGAVAAREWRDRQNDSIETRALTIELQQVCRRLATLALQVPEVADREPWIREIFELNMRKEALEEERAALIYQSKRSATDVISVEDLDVALPPDTALVDILQYSHTGFTSADKAELSQQERFVAFVARRGRPIVRVDLGEVAPIAEAVTNWRRTRGFRPNKGKQDWSVAAGELLWPPIKGHVDGYKTVLISPDGLLSRLNWNVLPGEQPDSYLIEDFAIGVVAVPQLLPALLRDHRGEEKLSRPDSLLLVGDIDYSTTEEITSSDEEPPAYLGGFRFGPLKATAQEIEALGRRFEQAFPERDLTVLDKGTATEEAFYKHAPQHRWLHIATHGFFAPSNIRTAIATQARMDPDATPRDGVSVFHVGYLNGLALAGANVGSPGADNDGIVTTIELSTTDLRNVELAVLSGCETGLGEVQSGEGSFGMQRALQIAGVRSTVGSLWTVSDKKTNLLMQRFYENLWDKKMSRLEALRQAQLWMLNTGGTTSKASQSDQPAKRLSPHYWAGFMLSGDWR